MNLIKLIFGPKQAAHAHAAPTADAHVTPDASRCVQCGVCGYNCPVGIPVRDYARIGKVVDDPRCVQCGQCIEVCPRGTLRWSRGHLEDLAEPDEAEDERLMGEFFPEGKGQA
jgi:ferredoxin